MKKINKLHIFWGLVFWGGLALNSQGGLVPGDYEQWQGYNGWPIQVITFPGIKSFSRAELLSAMATEKPTWLRRYVRLGNRTTFYADDFAADLYRLEHFYAREGFPRAKIRGYVLPREKYHELQLKLEIVEGAPLLLESYTIESGESTDVRINQAQWAKKMPIKTGKRLALSAIQASADTLRYQLQEMGRARATVQFKIETDSLRNTAKVVFTLFPGHFCVIGHTKFSGLKQITQATARRELTYREYEAYSPRKLEETRLKLVRLESFNFVNVKADTATPGDTLTVYVRTEEGKRYRLRFGGGYDTEERSRAEAEFTDLNFFGRARRFTVSTGWAEIRRRIEARLFWPHTPWNATDITLIPKWELNIEPGFHLETQSGTTILSAAPLDKVVSSLSNEVGSTRRRLRDTGETLRYIKSVETFSTAWDTRDNPLVPRKGHFVGYTVSESGAFYRTAQRWWRMVLHARVLQPITRFTVIAAKAETGWMGPLYDTHVTPVEERFYLGGPSSVRGWSRNLLSPRSTDGKKTPVGGDFTFHASVELRQNVWGPVTLTVFTDAGNVWKNAPSVQPINLFPSVGMGLLFLTPVGPIRLDYAHQLRPNPYHESLWAVYISLGTPF